MEMLSGAVLFAVLNLVTELILIALVKPAWKLRVLGNDKAMVAVHLIVGGLTGYVHWGTVTGSGSAMIAFIASFPTLWIAKQCIFGYVRKEPKVLTQANWVSFKRYLTAVQIAAFEKGATSLEALVPVYHRRLIGYKVSELI